MDSNKRTVTEKAALARLRRRLFGGDKTGRNASGYWRVRAGLYSEGHSRAEFEQWLRAAGALADFEVLEGTP